MLVYMVYCSEVDSEQGYYADSPVGVFRTPQDITTATEGEVPPNVSEWRHPDQFSGYEYDSDDTTWLVDYGDCGEYVIKACDI